MGRRLRFGTMLLAAAVLAAGCGDDDDAATCGDGVATGSEVCDGADLLGVTCVDLGYAGGTLECRADCTGPVVTGCTAAPSCGNGTIDGTEVCDGTELGGATCAGLGQGFTGGELTCTAGCALDPTGCTAVGCGNGVLEGTEQCDGSDFGGLTCESLGMGFIGGELTCSETCDGFFDDQCVSVAPGCGNGVIDGTEVCDASELQDNTCVDLGFGYTGGTLACQPTCQDWDVSGCTGLQTVTPLPNGCLSPSYVFPAGGEETHFVAVRVEPSAYPFTVTAIGYVQIHYQVGNVCDATLDHEVAVFVAPSTTPPAEPTLLETIAVPGLIPSGNERRVLAGLTNPITLQAGDQLFVAIRNAGVYPAVTCLQTCHDPSTYAADQTWWSNSGTPPYPWATLASFGITSTVNAFALGTP